MSHGSEPPGLPEVTDEAGDSPRWLPLLGLSLLGVVLLVWAVTRATGGDPTPVPEDPPAAEATEAAAG